MIYDESRREHIRGLWLLVRTAAWIGFAIYAVRLVDAYLRWMGSTERLVP